MGTHDRPVGTCADPQLCMFGPQPENLRTLVEPRFTELSQSHRGCRAVDKDWYLAAGARRGGRSAQTEESLR
jgi:hypothetical protein